MIHDYKFVCPKCKTKLTLSLQKFIEPDHAEYCLYCKVKMNRAFEPVVVHYKSTGFYTKDNQNGE